MNIKEVEKAIGRIQTNIFRNSNAYSIGMLKSHFKGSGIHFKEHQVYHHGDDTRFIDWNLSARSTNVYVKTFEEERNVEISIYINITNSMFTGSNGVSKLQVALEIASLVYLLSKSTGDKVKTSIYGKEKIEVPLKSGEEGMVAFIASLSGKEIINTDGQVQLTYQYKVNGNKNEDLVKSMRLDLSRKKEVIYLGDLADLEVSDQVNKMIKQKNFHGVDIKSPVDRGALNFSLPTKGKKGLQRLGVSDDTEKTKYTKVIRLNTDERYLEGFIKRMI